MSSQISKHRQSSANGMLCITNTGVVSIGSAGRILLSQIDQSHLWWSNKRQVGQQRPVRFVFAPFRFGPMDLNDRHHGGKVSEPVQLTSLSVLNSACGRTQIGAYHLGRILGQIANAATEDTTRAKSLAVIGSRRLVQLGVFEIVFGIGDTASRLRVG